MVPSRFSKPRWSIICTLDAHHSGRYVCGCQSPRLLYCIPQPPTLFLFNDIDSTSFLSFGLHNVCPQADLGSSVAHCRDPDLTPLQRLYPTIADSQSRRSAAYHAYSASHRWLASAVFLIYDSHFTVLCLSSNGSKCMIAYLQDCAGCR